MLTINSFNTLMNLTEDSWSIIAADVELYSMSESFGFDELKDYLGSLYNELKSTLIKTASQLNLTAEQVYQAFSTAWKQKSMLQFLKAIGFSVKSLIKGVMQLTDLGSAGLIKIFEELNKFSAFQKIESGLMTIDQVIAKYPMLSKVKGPALVALIFIGWVNMTFIGSVKYDFKWDQMLNAIKGNESLASVLAGPKGMMFIALIGTGTILNIGWAWFGLAGNVVFALVYTAYSNSSSIDLTVLNKLRKRINR